MSVAKGALRSMKNVAKGYSDLQVLVREVTSNDPTTPNPSLMQEIANQTSSEHSIVQISQIVTKRLNDHGRNWRHVHKTLILLEYIAHRGSTRAIEFVRSNLVAVKTLREFNYIDEYGIDCGLNVRVAAKSLTELLGDEDRLMRERRPTTERWANEGSRSFEPDDMQRAMRESLHNVEHPRVDVSGMSEEEQIRLAIELSRIEAEGRVPVRLTNSARHAPNAPLAAKAAPAPLIDLLGDSYGPPPSNTGSQGQFMQMPPTYVVPQQNPFNSAPTFAAPASFPQPAPQNPFTQENPQKRVDQWNAKNSKPFAEFDVFPQTDNWGQPVQQPQQNATLAELQMRNGVAAPPSTQNFPPQGNKNNPFMFQ